MRHISRVLQVVAVMNQGGAENMIMNYYRAADKSKIQFDFLVHYPKRGFFDDEIEKMGGHIYRAMPIRPWNYSKYFKWLDSFFKEHHDYVAIHSHIQENSGLVFKYAVKYGIKIRIANSHIADLGIDYKYLFRQFGKYYLNKYVTDRFACGKEAGNFLYGNKDFYVFKNAIKVDNFVFNTVKRNEERTILNIPKDAIVIGHVGRFNPQKNHTFLIDIFKEIYSKNNKAVLVMVGDGGLRNSIEDKVKSCGLSGSVYFLGLRSNVHEIMQAFDVLLFPSLDEGLPVSIIEAQASGLQCILSDTIDKDTDVTGNCRFVSLSTSIAEWADITLKSAQAIREDNTLKIQAAGYDVTKNIEWLTNFYLKYNE